MFRIPPELSSNGFDTLRNEAFPYYRSIEAIEASEFSRNKDAIR